MRQDTVERNVLDHIFGNLFAPRRLAYLSRAVDAAVAEGTKHDTATAAQRRAVLADARRKLENIKAAIADGIRTPTTKAMLEEAERRVAALDAAAGGSTRRPAPVGLVETAIDRYLADLRTTLESDIDGARQLLTWGFERIVLRRDDHGRLWAGCAGVWLACSISKTRIWLLVLVPGARLTLRQAGSSSHKR